MLCRLFFYLVPGWRRGRWKLAKTPRAVLRVKNAQARLPKPADTAPAPTPGLYMERSQSRISLSASFEALAIYFPCMNSFDEDDGGEWTYMCVRGCGFADKLWHLEVRVEVRLRVEILRFEMWLCGSGSGLEGYGLKSHKTYVSFHQCVLKWIVRKHNNGIFGWICAMWFVQKHTSCVSFHRLRPPEVACRPYTKMKDVSFNCYLLWGLNYCNFFLTWEFNGYFSEIRQL